MKTIKKHKVIILIILIAAFLRFYGISRGDPINDETLMGFRSIGMIDFDEAEFQTTPFEWFDPMVKFSTTVPDNYRIGTGIPWWAYLSWHDHPALVFAVEHFFMSIFGEHVWAFRLPSALLGVASVYLLYLLGKRLYDEHVGLVAALFYAITLNGIYISRTGMQEPYVIFFILLTLYFFLCAKNKDKYFMYMAVALGLGTLAKYTVLFTVAPIIATLLLLFRQNIFKNRKFLIGVVVFVIIISPSILYNIELYRAVGHFDFQFSTIFQQSHPAWQVQPGKDIGSLTERINIFIPQLISTNSWLFLLLFAMSIIGFFISIVKNGTRTIQRHSFLTVSFFFLSLLLLGIGPSYRFLTMLTPFMALGIGTFLDFAQKKLVPLFTTNIFLLKNFFALTSRVAQRFSKVLTFLFAIIVLFEIFYSYNNQIAYYPMGAQPWLSSQVRYENYNWGYNELNDYFENEFAGKIPALSFDMRYQFLNQLRDAALQRGIRQGLPEYPALVVYYGNFDKAGRLWSLDRLHIYHAWPVISLQDYYDYLQKSGADFYDKMGFKNFYFVIPTNTASVSSFDRLVLGVTPIEIKNPRRDTAFLVYKKF